MDTVFYDFYPVNCIVEFKKNFVDFKKGHVWFNKTLIEKVKKNQNYRAGKLSYNVTKSKLYALLWNPSFSNG